MLLYSTMQISCSSCSIKLTSVLGLFTFAVTSHPYVPESSRSILSSHDKMIAGPTVAQLEVFFIVGRICNNFEKNRALCDKSMKLGTWLVDNKTKKLRVSATPKMPSNGRHLVFPKWPPFSTFSL